MKVIVFGATGSIGRLAVKQLLTDGYDVTAFARRPERMDDLSNPRLTLAKGDATDAATVANTIAGHDAVVVTLGAGASRKSTIRSQGTLNVIQGMHQHGVRRLICQSTLGAHESWANLNFFWKRIMFGALLRPVFLDHELQENLVRASGLDWTIVRPSAFNDKSPIGRFKIGFGPSERRLTLKIARRDVAAFLARQLSEPVWLRRAVGISN
ncbi:NAD(P)-binding oxidoreductase [Alisedimentitalea sp. MJ-SS2]|uniref:NAD(P)-dependent oxidoreductase n=1 Tax=Aliisedimentitalea sp. MJ-SS2 TaxID=3049795 RepID=UPI00290F32BC|nr:NAD(P)-binding oxidoreductase [Alisedimentitalea sp. MJ-SS2]MDU8929844.1 NAD(P)-binding oxidoreductase [Alisedimentitalea sp. MJ-SS2]